MTVTPVLFIRRSCLVLFVACISLPALATSQADAALARAMIQITPHYPPSTSLHATTDGHTYLSNLSAQIETQQRINDIKPAQRLSLAANLYQRWRVLGDAENLNAATQQLNTVLLAMPHSEKALRLAAAMAMAEHRFEAAGHFLARAAKANPDSNELTRRQRELALATGGDVAAEELTTLEASDWPDAAMAARTYTDQGRPDLATAVLRDAVLNYRDTNPYPLAWLSVQQGIVFLRNGQHQAARAFFAAAVERLPQYTLALEHLGEVELALGNLSAAKTAYDKALSNTRAPLFLWQQSQVLAAQDDQTASQALRAEALHGLRESIERAPLLVAGHGVDLLLEAQDVEQALALAQLNAQQRNTWRADATLSEAALAAGQNDDACSAYRQARAAAPNAPEIRRLAAQMEEVCASG